MRRRARAARDRARGSSGSRRPLPSSAACGCGRRPRPSGGSPGGRASRFEQVDLALRLVLDGATERTDRVEVLDLAAGAEGLAARRGASTRWRRRASIPLPSWRRSPRWRGGWPAARRRTAVASSLSACRGGSRSRPVARRRGCSRPGVRRRRGCDRPSRRGGSTCRCLPPCGRARCRRAVPDGRSS